MVLILAAATLWGLLRGYGAAMAGVWFFLILAPSSSVIPQADPIFEHRLYLPLAGLAALVVVGLYAMLTGQSGGKESPAKAPMGLQVAAAVVLLAAAATCGWLTYQGNKVYASPVAFWEATVATQTTADRHSYRAESELGQALIKAGRTKEGIDHLLLALRVDSSRWEGQWRLASELMAAGRHADAFGSLNRLKNMRPNWVEPYRMLGECYEHVGQVKLAAEYYEQALKRQPDNQAIQQALERVKGQGPPEAPTTRATQPTQPTRPASAP
jgi:tetratricopeptide (TPR) repeat protein